MRKVKTPEEKASYEAKRAAQRRKWAIEHPELNRSYGRAFYQRNKEKRKAYSREYNRSHREERLAYSREYYRRKKAENPNYVKEINERCRLARIAKGLTPYPKRTGINIEKHRLSQQKYYMKHRLEICKKSLNYYPDKRMLAIRKKIPERVEQFFNMYPFDTYGDRIIKNIIYRIFNIHKNSAPYDDCYEAGMLAYLYSIHRCAELNCDYTVPYIKKIVRIYIGTALIIYNETRNLCKNNNFREIRIDADIKGRLY